MTITCIFLNQSYLIQPEIIRALKKVAGIRVIVLDITSHPTAAQSARAVELFREYDCRLLVTVNEWGIDAEGIIPSFVASSGVVHINWCVDDPFYEGIMLRKKFLPSPGRIDFVSDRDYLERMCAEGYNAHFLPLGTDPGLFFPSEKACVNDCAFVGNSYLAQIDEFTRGAEPLLTGMVPFLAKCMQRYYRDATVDVAAEVGNYLETARLQEDLTHEKAAFIAKHFAGYLFRKHIVGALLAALPGFFVYGDEGWLQVTGNDRLRKVRYDRALCEVYSTTKVNVDINRVVIRNGFTQRIFDVLASGSLVITSAKPIVEEFFMTSGPHQEVAMFSSAEELIDKVRYYLKHDDERMAIAQRGREKVLTKHTYDHRIREMFRVVSEQFG